MSTIKYINELLERYYSGKTSVEEERILMNFFSSTSDLGELEPHRGQFLLTQQFQSLDADYELNSRLIGQLHHSEQSQKPLSFNRSWMRVAATIVFFLIAFGLGRVSKPSTSVNEDKLTKLQNEINSVRLMMMVALLNQPNASDRIRAVQMTKNTGFNTEKVLDILTSTISDDENTNVRIASVKALYEFKNYGRVKEILINALMSQEEPIVQMELIRVIQELKVELTIEDLHIIFENNYMDSDVQKEAKNLITVI